MRILFLTNFYPPHDIGGYEQWCQAVVEGLIAREHHVQVLTSEWRRSGVQNADEAHVSRTLHQQANLEHYSAAAFLFVRWLRERENLITIKRMLKEFRPDVVFIWGMWNLGRDLAAWVESRTECKTVYYISDLWPLDPDMHLAYWSQEAPRSILRLPWQVASRLALRCLRTHQERVSLQFRYAVTVSDAVRTALLSAGLPFSAATVIHGGCQPELFLPRPSQANRRLGQLSLVYVGALANHKGVETLLQAMALLAGERRDENISLALAGSGHPDYVSRLRAFVTANGLDENVTFLGRLEHVAVPGLLAQHDALVFPSEWLEPFARTPLEAMLAGLPVITTLTGGTRELVESECNALAFEAGDGEALAFQIRRLAWDPVLAQRLADAGRASVLARFTLNRMIAGIDAYLRSVVSPGGVMAA
jgi:glycosyltransferase involved in cell wall biosynthesis